MKYYAVVYDLRSKSLLRGIFVMLNIQCFHFLLCAESFKPAGNFTWGVEYVGQTLAGSQTKVDSPMDCFEQCKAHSGKIEFITS